MSHVEHHDEPEGLPDTIESADGVVLARRRPTGWAATMSPSEAASKSWESRRARKAEEVRDETLRKEILKRRLDSAPSRADLKGRAAAVVHLMAERILIGDIPVNTAREAASITDTFFAVLRLESNQATSVVEHATREEKIATITALREAAAERKSS